MKKIENPKVFISYAWSTKEYEEKVEAFASKLVQDGIDVLFDKWSIEPGTDTINYMEKCVKDKTVNYVLILLDSIYTSKADNKEGGVGIETQIISKKVYDDVDQSKFIPIVFSRDSNGNVASPVYLKSRLYFDFTNDHFEEEYVKLVKYIYGEPFYRKPELGNKPAWVENSIQVSTLKYKLNNNVKFDEALDELLMNIKELQIDDKSDISIEEIIVNYNKMLDLRNCLIELFIRNYSDNYFLDSLLDFYEKVKKWNNSNSFLQREIWDSYVHETFIYLIAVLFKNHNYSLINKIIAKSYFLNRHCIDCCEYFYSNNYSIINNAKNSIDDQQYLSPVAQLWMDNVYEPKISKADLIFSDLLIYNLSMLLIDCEWYWFPITYIYGGIMGQNSYFGDFSIKLKSKYEVDKFKELFDINDSEELKYLFEKKKTIIDNNRKDYRFPQSFSKAETFLDYINITDICMFK